MSDATMLRWSKLMQETPAAAAGRPWQAQHSPINISNRAKTVKPMLASSLLLWISTCRAISSEQKAEPGIFPFSLFSFPFILTSSFFLRLICSGPSHFHFSSRWPRLTAPSYRNNYPLYPHHALSDVVPFHHVILPQNEIYHPSLAPLRHAVAVDAPSLTKHPS